MPRRACLPLLATLLSSAALAACGGDGDGAPDRPPSLLLVIFDTVRADHLSAYGHARETSPTVDALAARGVLFEEAWAQASLTPISAATLFTGTQPYRHGIRSLFMVGKQRLAPDVPTLAELLTDQGWNAAGFVGAAPMGDQYGLDRGFAPYDDDLGRAAAERAAKGVGNAYQRRADEVVDRALGWLDGALADERPFALLVHTFDAHDATLVPPRAFLEPRVSFPLPADLDRRGDLLAVQAPQRRIELYDAEIEYQDAQLGRLLDALEAAGRLDDTLVAFVSDHGEGLGAHDHWTHGLLYAEQLRVPWVLAGPGVPGPERVDRPVALVDFLPTVAPLLGLYLPPGLDLAGVDALGDPGAASRAFYAEVHHAPGNHLGADPRMYSLRVGPWKLIHRPSTGAHELYDLDADPLEEHNVYAEDHPVARILLADLVERGAVLAEPGELDGDVEAMLRELGYF